VEGLFDLALLWQAGFRHTTSALGTHLSSAQFEQLCNWPGRAVSIVFDEDENQAGQHAARRLAQRLKRTGVTACIAHLPDGHDPASYFLAGATRRDFAACLERAEQP
jgi:DNA primase